MEKRREKILFDFVTGTILIIILAAIFFTDGWNCAKYQVIGYDEGYNATVAANLAQTGEYKVSYPENIVFYNRISTGAPVIVPAALLYHFFGINAVTTNLVPLVYGTLSIFLLYFLLAIVLKKGPAPHLLAAAVTAGTVLTDLYFEYVSVHLIGEGAVIFYLLLCLLGMGLFYEKRKHLFLLLAGAALAAAFLTKTSMIFFMVTVFGILLIETLLTKTIPGKSTGIFLTGFVAGFALVDAIKLIQLGSLQAYLKWWAAEWTNMLSQSSGVDLTYSIRDKINYLPQVFGINPYLSLAVIALPVCLYGVHVICRGVLKKDFFRKNELSLVYGGVAGSSLLVYFILLGGSGLVYARRLSANAFFVRFAAGALAMLLAEKAGKRFLRRFSAGFRTVVCITVGLAAAGILIFHPSQLRGGMVNYLSKLTEKDYDAHMMDVFLEEVDALPENAVLYCWGWWQEPDVKLLLGKDMVDLQRTEAEKIDRENGYFIIGRRFDNQQSGKVAESRKIQLTEIDKITVDYNLLVPFNSYELYSIYKIG